MRTVAGRAIPPGETRLIPASALPPNVVAEIEAAHRNETATDEPATDEQDDDAALSDAFLCEILQGTVAEILQSLPDLDDVLLARLEMLEYDSASPRKGVLEGISALQLQRAESEDSED